MWTAKRIKELRQQYGESREDFAKRLGVVLGTLRNWEQDLNEPIGPAQLLLDRLEEDLKEGKKRDLQPA